MQTRTMSFLLYCVGSAWSKSSLSSVIGTGPARLSESWTVTNRSVVFVTLPAMTLPGVRVSRVIWPAASPSFALRSRRLERGMTFLTLTLSAEPTGKFLTTSPSRPASSERSMSATRPLTLGERLTHTQSSEWLLTNATYSPPVVTPSRPPKRAVLSSSTRLFLAESSNTGFLL